MREKKSFTFFEPTNSYKSSRCTYFSGQRLFRSFAESLIVDKRAVGALGILEIKLAVLVPEQRVVPRQHLAVKDGVGGAGPRPRHRPSHFDGLVEEERSVLERVRVWPADQGGLGTEAADAIAAAGGGGGGGVPLQRVVAVAYAAVVARLWRRQRLRRREARHRGGDLNKKHY